MIKERRCFLIFAILLALTPVALGQLPNPSGQVWREYPTGPTWPPKMESSGTPTADLPMNAPTILDMVKRETDESSWTGQNFGLIGTNGQKLFVYHNPAMQQRVGETVGRFLRPETRHVPFVMETMNLTLADDFAEKMIIDAEAGFSSTDSATVFSKYLHPIFAPKGEPGLHTQRISAYRVNKDNIPKLYESWGLLFHRAEGDSRSEQSTGLKLVTHNGQLGAILVGTPRTFFTGHELLPEGVQPVYTTIHEGATVCGFSLLSWDGRTVDSDVHVEYTQVTDVERKTQKYGEVAYVIPKVTKFSLSEKGLRWPVDGMLVVIMESQRLVERKIEHGTPMLSKIPYFHRLFKNTAIGRTTQTVYTVVTVRQAGGDRGH